MSDAFHIEPRQLFPHFAEEIDTFYRAEFRYRSRCANPRFPTVDINRVAVRLYLRFTASKIGPGNTVVIAVIGFRDQRRGHGTRLLAKLVEIANRYDITSIGVEQTSSKPGIQNFLKKFGFKNHIDDRNWIVSIEMLREHLVQASELGR
jgi:GNAT superfamily N-acetyltransferase